MLPPGIHTATVDEIEARFATSPERRTLFDGFKSGCAALAAAGCTALYLDGSFVTDKPAPGDFDACWDPAGVDPQLLDPVFLDFAHGRRNQKRRFGGEFFPSTFRADRSSTFSEYLRVDKQTGLEKGIVRLELHPNVLSP